MKKLLFFAPLFLCLLSQAQTVTKDGKVVDTTGKYVYGATLSATGDSFVVFKNGVRTATKITSSGGGGSDSALWKNDGSLTGNRVLTMGGKTLTFGGGKSIFDSLSVTQTSAFIGQFYQQIFTGTSVPSGVTAITPNATITYSNKAIITGGNNTLNNYLLFDQYFNYNKQKLTFKVVVQDRTSTSYGIGITQALNALNFSSSYDIRWNFSSGSDSGRCSYNGVYSPNLYISAGDTLFCEWETDGWQQTVSTYNKRTLKKTQVTVNTSVIGTGGKLKLVAFGGTQHILSFTAESFNTPNSGIAIIGDSQAAGSGATIEANAWINVLFGANKYRYNNYSHPSITADYWLLSDWPNLKAQRPQYALLEIGYNDRRDLGDDSSAYKVRVVKILDSLLSINTIAILTTLIPSASGVGAATDKISIMLQNLAISRNLRIIDIRTVLLNGTSAIYAGYVSNDNVHLSDSGHYIYATAIKQFYNEVMNDFVGDSTSAVKLNNIPTGNEGMNILAIDSKGNIYKIPNTLPKPATWLPNAYSTNGSLPAGIATINTQIHTMLTAASDSGLYLSGKNGANIVFGGKGNFTALPAVNTSSSYPIMFANNMQRSVVINTQFPWYYTIADKTGVDNTIIGSNAGNFSPGSYNYSRIAAYGFSIGNSLTTGTDMLGMGYFALAGITTGNNVIDLTTMHRSDNPGQAFTAGSTGIIAIGTPNQYGQNNPVNGETVIATHPNGGDRRIYTFGPSFGFYDSVLFRPGAAWNLGTTNSAGKPWIFRGSEQTGDRYIGSAIQDEFSLPVASGSTAQTVWPTVMKRELNGVSIGQAIPLTKNPSAVLDIQSTKMGVIIPRMTTSQRDSILRPISLTIVVNNGGSSYTSNPTVIFSTPIGSFAAKATANLTGSVVTSITVNDPGLYSTNAPTISFSGGGGTGATATATLQPFPVGLSIYNLDATATDASTGVQQTFNGSVWKNNW